MPFKKGCVSYNKGKPAWNKGMPMSEEQKAKLSESHKKLNLVGSNNPNFGKSMPEEQKAKISRTRIEREVAKGENNPMFGVNRSGENNPMFGKKRPDVAARIGELHPMFGRTHRPDSLLKMRDVKLGEQNSMFGKSGPLSPAFREKNFNWKGGITPLTKQIRGCFEYKQWRSDIFIRDDFTCLVCKKRGGDLEVDHNPKMFSEIIEEYAIKDMEQALVCSELWDINNGRTLCVDCHREAFTMKE